MVFSELNSVDMALIIEDLVETGCINDYRLVSLLQDIASDNNDVDRVNMFILKYKAGEVSEKDLLIAINKYRASKQSVVD